MHHVLRPVLHEGAIGSTFLSSPKIILLIVLNERSFSFDVPIDVRVIIGLCTPVLVVENHIGVSVYTLDTDAETVCAGSITVGPGGARQLSVAPLWSIVRNASHSVGLHQECRRKINPSPWIRWLSATRGSDRLSAMRHHIIQHEQMFPTHPIRLT